MPMTKCVGRHMQPSRTASPMVPRSDSRKATIISSSLRDGSAMSIRPLCHDAPGTVVQFRTLLRLRHWSLGCGNSMTLVFAHGTEFLCSGVRAAYTMRPKRARGDTQLTGACVAFVIPITPQGDGYWDADARSSAIIMNGSPSLNSHPARLSQAIVVDGSDDRPHRSVPVPFTVASSA